VFDGGELSDLAPAKTKTIDIEDFVALEDIDPIYFDRTYHLAPAGEPAKKAYALLAGVMEDRQRVGIGKVVMREKQYLAAIRPYGKGLAMSTMLFADEVVPQSTVDGIPARKPTVASREKQMALQIVDSMEREWDPKRYHDDYEEQLRRVITAKAKGKTIEAPEPEESAQVLDLMEALRASIEGKPRAKKAAPRARTAAKSTKRSAARPRRAPKKRTASRRSA
jgi:DNA end-binding protein Ku